MKKIDGTFYNLDSKLDSPQLIGKVCFLSLIILNCFLTGNIKHFHFFQDSDLLSYLKDQIESKEKELFIVVSREIESSQQWLTEFSEKNSADKNTESIDYIKQTVIENLNNHNSCNNAENKLIENGNFCNDQSSR